MLFQEHFGFDNDSAREYKRQWYMKKNVKIAITYFSSQYDIINQPVQSRYGNKVWQIRSGGPSGGFKDDFLRSGGG